MVTVFLKNDNIKVKVPLGTTMRQVALKSGAAMEFGCRVGDCGTCIAHVTSGMDKLNTKSDKELHILGILGGNVRELRLMCQCEVRCEEGEIEISYGL
ncbi:2Fe-2S iron-sulfur cluster-binding protein [Sulfurimonas sp. HSL3-7]|uniref:2Fe-2S iron-sulfur cluster-binding protein n=1 Tax=Sulfonitrofixus jiaomeiensis TaxID=3131938 RepID=UPI0031F7294D